MSSATAEAIIVEDLTVGSLSEQKPESDPRVTRWIYNPGQKGISIDPRRTGIKGSSFIAVGKFIALAAFMTTIENFTIDEYKEKELPFEVTAQDAENAIMEALGVWGAQKLFYGITDRALVAVINAAVLPSLSGIRALAFKPSPIGVRCPGEDENDLGEAREACAACHLKWIKSDECTAYLEMIADEGLPVTVNIRGVIEQRIVKPLFADLNTARSIVRKGLEIYTKRASDEWATIISQLDNKLRVQLNDEEHLLRKNLHQPKPQNKEAEMVKQISESQNENSHNVIAQMAENQRSFQEMMMQQAAATNQMVQLLAANLLPGATVAPQEASAGKTKRATTKVPEAAEEVAKF